MSEDEEIIGCGADIIQFKNALDCYEILYEEASLNAYRSSGWKKMVEEWRKEHPMQKRVLTQEEKDEADRQLAELNKKWHQIQEEKKQKKVKQLKSIEDLNRLYP